MSIYVDSLVILEHPMMLERYVLAKIVKVSNVMIHVIYWKETRKEWGEEVHRRKANAVVNVLGNASDFHELGIQKRAEQLTSARAEMSKRVLDARRAYLKKVKEMK